jgi:hypothetical protein
MIRVTLIGTTELKARFEALYPKARDAVFRSVSKLAIGLQTYIRADKLSGQVLKNRTGTLRRSIIERVDDGGTIITGIVAADMGVAKYAAAQNYGFSGTVDVRAHTRRISQAFGRAISPREINVGAHAMRMNLPARNYMESSLAEFQPRVEAELSEAVREAVEQ